MAESSNERPKRQCRSAKRREEHLSAICKMEKGRWSTIEKEQLLRGLERYGHLDIQNISKLIPTRTSSEIGLAIKYWKRLAQIANIKRIHKSTNLAGCSKQKLMKRRIPESELKISSKVNEEKLKATEQWIDFFVNSLSQESHGVFALSNIFKLIAEFEALPSMIEAGGISFRELYLWLHDILNGQPMKPLSGPTLIFLADSLKKLAAKVRASGMYKQRAFIGRLVNNNNSWSPVNLKTYSKKKEKNEEKKKEDENTEAVMKLPDLNPLLITLENLEMKP